MGKLYIFRGKAATGKSTITDLVCKEFKICILRKDDIYDILSESKLEHTLNNNLSYGILANIIKTNLLMNNELIIDIALANPLHLKEFISHINLNGIEIKNYQCICSNEQEWKRRMEKRITKPTPNQLFKSVDDAIEHYRGYDTAPIKGEVIIDSSLELLEILEALRKDFE